MAATTTITVRIPEETKAKLEKIAEAGKRSLSYVAAEAIEAFVETELPIIEGILEAYEDIEAGRTIPHDEAMEQIYAAIEQASRRKSA